MNNPERKVNKTRMKEYIIKPAVSDENKIFCPLLCGITYPDKNYRIKRKNSDFYVIEYVISGEGTIINNGKRYSLCAGDSYILSEGGNHEYFSAGENPWSKIWLNVKGNIISPLLSVYGLDGITLVKGVDIYDEMKKILKINKSDKLSSREKSLETQLVFCRILNMLHDGLNEDKGVSEEATILKEYINSHYSEEITIEKLSKLIFRSESQTVRIFKGAYEMTPYDYVIFCRIKNAVFLLKNTRMPIKEIAYGTGFKDEHHFSNVFKKRIGKTPMEYRKAAKVIL